MPFDFDTAVIKQKQTLYPDLGRFLKWMEEVERKEGVKDDVDMWIARAPGRLDVMGGISDYSGGCVLQLPIKRACFAAVQLRPDASTLRITSFRHDQHQTTYKTSDEEHIQSDGRCCLCRWESAIEELNSCAEYGRCRELFTDAEWAGYVAGCLIVLKNEGYVEGDFSSGMSIFLMSDVPEGKGVSSSACVEVASMKAIVAALNLEMDDCVLAQLCQIVENRVVGASCGIMDQMTAMFGQEGKLMQLLCQPCTLVGHLELPSEYTIIGIDSGERHSISGSDYSSVRTGAFMGLKILQRHPNLHRNLRYLAELTPKEMQQLEDCLPDAISGEAFIETYGSHIDSVTKVDREKIYRIRQPARHPVLEMARVQSFCALLEEDGDVGVRLGALMHASHVAYQSLGLDSPATNALYDLTLDAVMNGIYGGKISGGGSGGTVCILISKKQQEQAIHHLRTEFKCHREDEDDPMIFEGSSNGTHHFGVLHLPSSPSA